MTAGRLLAAGRDCDIFEHGEGLVLRRSRRGNSMAQEARVMEYVRSAGYPVPGVESINDDGTELVMERVDGVSMGDLLMRRPWMLRSQGALLADLHERLHRIAAPPWIRPSPIGNAGDGDSLLHLDLHPLNVMVTARGPFVIDWPNAARGNGLADVGLAWLLMACGGIPVGALKSRLLGVARASLVAPFLARFDVAEVRRLLPAVLEWKARDTNMTPAEVAAMRRLAATG